MFASLFIGATMASATKLHASLSVVDSQVDFRSESFLVDYQLTNAGPGPVKFLPWKTPLDMGEVFEDMFLVQDASGLEIPYTGKIARRGDVQDHHFVTIQEGESLGARVDLTMSYMVPADGLVSVTMKHLNATGAPAYASVNKIKLVAVHIASQAERVQDVLAAMNPGQGHGRNLLQTFTACTASQVTAARNGRNVAINTQIPRAITCIGTTGAPCARYTTWFGALTSTRWNTVSRCWANIRRDMPLANFNCCTGCGANCGTNLYAFVYPSDRTMTIYLCGLFFSIPSEQGETMTHEQSHFTVTCATQDHAYGVTACQNLARTNPDRAVQNADNHCFFGAR